MNARKTFKRALLALLLLVFLGYQGIIAWFRVNESRLLYTPDRDLSAPADTSLIYQRVEITTGDSVKLSGLTLPAPAADSTATWVLFLHGSGGNVFSGLFVAHYRLLQSLGLNVLAVDYRGYGTSGGKPSEAGLYLDADATYDYLTNTLHVPPTRIIIYGWSLGSGVAVELASKVRAAGLIVEGAYKSIPAVGQEHYPYVPVKLIARNRFASIDRIAQVRMPKLFIHAVDDEMIPVAHGRALFQKALTPKMFLEVHGGHDSTLLRDGPTFMSGVATFVHDLAPH